MLRHPFCQGVITIVMNPLVRGWGEGEESIPGLLVFSDPSDLIKFYIPDQVGQDHFSLGSDSKAPIE